MCWIKLYRLGPYVLVGFRQPWFETYGFRVHTQHIQSVTAAVDAFSVVSCSCM